MCVLFPGVCDGKGNGEKVDRSCALIILSELWMRQAERSRAEQSSKAQNPANDRMGLCR
jgi:hypothetical protein